MKDKLDQAKEELEKRREKVDNAKNSIKKSKSHHIESHVTGSDFDITSESGKKTSAKVSNDGTIETHGEEASEIKNTINNGQEIKKDHTSDKNQSLDKQKLIDKVNASELTDEMKKGYIQKISEADITENSQALENINTQIEAKENNNIEPKQEKPNALDKMLGLSGRDSKADNKKQNPITNAIDPKQIAKKMMESALERN